MEGDLVSPHSFKGSIIYLDSVSRENIHVGCSWVKGDVLTEHLFVVL